MAGAASLALASPLRASPDLVGLYDGRGTEIAAGLELRADGRFRYGLSYGALDEEAEGRWTAENDRVLLTSDAVAAPRFAVLDCGPAAAGQVMIELDLPDGLSRQYFRAELHAANGSVTDHQLSDDPEPLTLGPDEHPTSVTLVLPVYDLRSEDVPLSGPGGHRLRIRFEPHDLGKVAFARTPLQIERGDLILQRHDRDIRFRRQAR